VVSNPMELGLDETWLYILDVVLSVCFHITSEVLDSSHARACAFTACCCGFSVVRDFDGCMSLNCRLRHRGLCLLPSCFLSQDLICIIYKVSLFIFRIGTR
jgi:hypothetical protein